MRPQLDFAQFAPELPAPGLLPEQMMARPPTLAARFYWRTVWVLGVYALRSWLSIDTRTRSAHRPR